MPRAGIMQQPPPPSDQVMRTITGGFFFQVGVTLVQKKVFRTYVKYTSQDFSLHAKPLSNQSLATASLAALPLATSVHRRQSSSSCSAATRTFRVETDAFCSLV